jgi:hypothetical protein
MHLDMVKQLFHLDDGSSESSSGVAQYPKCPISTISLEELNEWIEIG